MKIKAARSSEPVIVRRKVAKDPREAAIIKSGKPLPENVQSLVVLTIIIFRVLASTTAKVFDGSDSPAAVELGPATNAMMNKATINLRHAATRIRVTFLSGQIA